MTSIPGLGRAADDPTDRCIACACTRFQTRYSVYDANQGVPGTWDIVACQNCGLGVLAPFPRTEEIAAFYQDRFYTADGKRFRGWVEQLRLMLAGLRGRKLNALIPSRGRLLDFGSGTGHFAAAQQRTGWTVWPIDPYSSASKVSEKVRMEGDRIILDFPDGYFDAVTLWYVIEHLRDPVAAIGEFSRVLKPGGYLVLSQQNFSSLQARFFGPSWLYLDPPRHLWQFDPNNLARIAADAGFACRDITHSSIESGPFTILQSTMNKIFGNQNYLFRILKNEKLPLLPGTQLVSLTPTMFWANVLVGCVLAPFAFIAYLLLLCVKSGDVFTLYLERTRP